MRKLLVTSLVVAVAASVLAASETERPDAYALRFPLQTKTDAGLQRVSLPPAALAAIESSQLADIRVFNASGEAVPIAILPLREETEVPSTRRVSFYPINATEQQQSALSGLHLRIDESAGRRIVTVDSSDKAAQPSSAATKQVGALVDSRSYSGKLDALTIDAALPVGEPVLLSVSASKDLKNWRTLADASPVFRFGGEGAPGNLRVPLNSAALDKEYLRITWPAQPVFTLNDVKLVHPPTSVPVQRIALPLLPIAGGASNELTVALPFATPLHALLVRPGAGNELLPIRIYARNAKHESWRAVTNSVIYRLASSGNESVNPPIELNGLFARELKIEATNNPSAFPRALPTVHAIVNPVSVAFVATGNPPFTLATGKKDARAIALPVSSLIPGYKEGSEGTLALATVDASHVIKAPTAPLSPLTAIKEKVGAPSERSLLLWGVLVGGVLLLGIIAWSILKQTATSNKKEV
jgi:Protein of unknown function (DUF3999)